MEKKSYKMLGVEDQVYDAFNAFKGWYQEKYGKINNSELVQLLIDAFKDK